MILCVTLAPAIDRVAHVPKLRLGEVLRPDGVSVLPGGKGVNVARAVRALGGDAMTTGFAGGHAGRWLVEALEREVLRPSFVSVAAETRTTYVTLDDRGRSTLVYEPAGPLGPSDMEALLRLLASGPLDAATWVVVSGSVPSGLGDDAVAQVVRACRAEGRPVLVDCGGPPLALALSAGPDVVKVSLEEAHAADIEGDTLTVARWLVGSGARLAAVTDGPRPTGVASMTGEGWWVDGPVVGVVNAVGSGDAFAAGMVLALARGDGTEHALAAGAAAGAANAERLAAGSVDRARVAELARLVRVRKA